jgi:NAD(P)-dependent dehydrogenase (short-subunit alcohol dehydrogenase family)
VSDAPRFVVVTGAAGGIGQALVRAFHDAGYRVVATDRVAQPPPSLAGIDYLEADLARTVHDEAYAAAVFDRIRARHGTGGLHALVNNAATQILGGVVDLTRDDWARTLDVNLLAPFVWTQAMLPSLEAVGGCVVNISSIHARLTKRGFVAYATSKAALSGMTRALAVDAGDRIRVNAIEPAAIETPMLAASFNGKRDLYAQLRDAHPAGRIGSPAEVAALAVALCDNRIAFVNGACVAIDGAIGTRLHDPD